MVKYRSKNTAVKKFVNMAMSCFLSHSSKYRGGCGDSKARGMTGLFRLGECNDSITTHLNTCHLSRESMTEFELILTRAGGFELPLPKVNEMMICPKHQQKGLLSDWLIDCLVPRFLLRARDRKIINKNGGRREGEFRRFV